MLLSEAKEQAQVLLNEAFYAYHASPAPHDELIAGRAGYGPGIYLLSSASPDYKGTPNGRSWIVTNKGVGMNFGRYIHKCVIPGSLDTTVLFHGDFTFKRISKGKIKSFDDIESFIENSEVTSYVKSTYAKHKERMKGFKDWLQKYFLDMFRGITVDSARPDFIIYRLNHWITWKLDEQICKNNFFPEHDVLYEYKNTDKRSRLIKLIHAFDLASGRDEEGKEYFFKNEAKQLVKNCFNFNLPRSCTDFKSTCIYIGRYIVQRLQQICQDLYKYYAGLENYFKNNYCFTHSYFASLFGNVDYYYKNKDFFRALGIIGFYLDKYAEDDVRVEEIVIWDPADVTVTSIKDVGELDENKFDDYVNLRPEHEKPTYAFRPKWDKDGYPLDKYINYDNSELPEQNKEISTGKEMQSAIEDQYRQNPRNRVSYIKGRHRLNLEKPMEYTTKNPHYRSKFVGNWWTGKPTLGDSPLYNVPSQSEFYKKIEKNTPTTNLPKKVKF